MQLIALWSRDHVCRLTPPIIESYRPVVSYAELHGGAECAGQHLASPPALTAAEHNQ
jgi:hypothetical protein